MVNRIYVHRDNFCVFGCLWLSLAVCAARRTSSSPIMIAPSTPRHFCFSCVSPRLNLNHEMSNLICFTDGCIRFFNSEFSAQFQTLNAFENENHTVKNA